MAALKYGLAFMLGFAYYGELHKRVMRPNEVASELRIRREAVAFRVQSIGGGCRCALGKPEDAK